MWPSPGAEHLVEIVVVQGNPLHVGSHEVSGRVHPGRVGLFQGSETIARAPWMIPVSQSMWGL